MSRGSDGACGAKQLVNRRAPIGEVRADFCPPQGPPYTLRLEFGLLRVAANTLVFDKTRHILSGTIQEGSDCSSFPQSVALHGGACSSSKKTAPTASAGGLTLRLRHRIGAVCAVARMPSALCAIFRLRSTRVKNTPSDAILEFACRLV